MPKQPTDIPASKLTWYRMQSLMQKLMTVQYLSQSINLSMCVDQHCLFTLYIVYHGYHFIDLSSSTITKNYVSECSGQISRKTISSTVVHSHNLAAHNLGQ